MRRLGDVKISSSPCLRVSPSPRLLHFGWSCCFWIAEPDRKRFFLGNLALVDQAARHSHCLKAFDPPYN